MEGATDFETGDEIQTLINNIFDLIPINNTKIRKCKEHALKQSIIIGKDCISILQEMYRLAQQPSSLVVPTSVSMGLEKEFDIKL